MMLEETVSHIRTQPQSGLKQEDRTSDLLRDGAPFSKAMQIQTEANSSISGIFIYILKVAKTFNVILAIFILSIIISIKPAIYALKYMVPLVSNAENKTMTIINEVYPDELEIKIKNGYVSTNVTEPYFVNANMEKIENIMLNKKTTYTKSKVRILTIDTKAKDSDLEKYQSMALLTQTSLVYYQDGKVNTRDFRDVKDVTINKKLIVSKAKEFIQSYRINNLTQVGIFAMPLLMILFYFFILIIELLLTSLLVYFMVKVNELSIGFRKTFRYTTFLSLIPFITGSLLSSPGIFNTSLITILILSFTYAGIVYVKKNPSCISYIEDKEIL
ncbi:MAG: DUF1189 domain-containing protein [Patescibacteria group bacterium]|nr:DUF1189 domain-containing protein [Patescibacteria group bacterium]